MADDNADAAHSLATLLRLGGHTVETALDGIEALGKLPEFDADIVFLDLGMPRMDGLETARRIRALPGGERPVLVALTGWGQAMDRTRTNSAGFDFHVVKPVSATVLSDLMSESANFTPRARPLR